jgi:hypothetical protein
MEEAQNEREGILGFTTIGVSRIGGVWTFGLLLFSFV